MILTLRANLAQQWPTVLMGQGSNDVLLMIQLKFLKILTIVAQFLELYIMFLFYCVNHWLFSRGTREGDSYLVEWNKMTGLSSVSWKRSVGVVQFDTMKNLLLATGDEFQIKFWDMDNVNILTTTAAEGGLPVMPMESLFLMCLAVL